MQSITARRFGRVLWVLAIALVVTSLVACDVFGSDSDRNPPVTIGTPTLTAQQAEAAALARIVLEPLVKKFGTDAQKLEVRALPLGLRDGEGEFWAAVTTGPQPVDFFHFAAVYRRNDGGGWSTELSRLELESAPQRASEVELLSVGPGAPAGTAYLVVRGPTGAHAGTLDIIAFDGDELTTLVSHISARPNAGEIVDLDGDGTPEVVLNDSDPLVFCYACAVEERRQIIQRWDGEDFVPVDLAVPAGLDAATAQEAGRVVALVEAGLWQDAAARAVELARRAPSNDAVRWLSILVNHNAAERFAHAEGSGQPLLANVLAGEYGAAYDLIRAQPPEQTFALNGPLIVGTAAETDLPTMGSELRDRAEAGLALRPSDAAIHAVHALGLALSSPSDLRGARQALARARAAAPNDAYLGAAATFLDAASALPGSVPAPPGPEQLVPGPDGARFDAGLTLGSGDEGPFVRALHQRLARVPGLGFEDPGRYHDVYDEPTRQAVLRLQLGAGVAPTGVVDGPTWDALERALQQPAPPPTPAPTPGVTVTTKPPVRPPAHGNSGESIVYFTFDDGPAPTWTAAVLDTLARYDAGATFFLLGSNVTRMPQLVARLVDEGHEAENHTFEHPSLDGIDRNTFIAEVQGTDRAIVDAAGERVQPIACLRPPYGATDSRTNAIAAELGKRVILWDIDTQDWRRPGPDRITDHILANARAGAVILMHDGGGERSQTVQALDATLAALAARGYAFAVMCD